MTQTLVRETRAFLVVRGSGGDGEKDRGALRAKVRRNTPLAEQSWASSSSTFERDPEPDLFTDYYE